MKTRSKIKFDFKLTTGHGFYTCVHLKHKGCKITNKFWKRFSLMYFGWKRSKNNLWTNHKATIQLKLTFWETGNYNAFLWLVPFDLLPTNCWQRKHKLLNISVTVWVWTPSNFHSTQCSARVNAYIPSLDFKENSLSLWICYSLQLPTKLDFSKSSSI